MSAVHEKFMERESGLKFSESQSAAIDKYMPYYYKWQAVVEETNGFDVQTHSDKLQSAVKEMWSGFDFKSEVFQ